MKRWATFYATKTPGHQEKSRRLSVFMAILNFQNFAFLLFLNTCLLYNYIILITAPKVLVFI